LFGQGFSSAQDPQAELNPNRSVKDEHSEDSQKIQDLGLNSADLTGHYTPHW
jgi:hypothetical protein